MKLSFLQTALMWMAFVGTASCSHSPKNNEALPQPEGTALAGPIERPAVREITDDDLKVRQIYSSDSGLDASWNEVLGVEQLNKEEPGTAAEFSFETIEGDHPCTSATQGTERCEAISRALAEAAAKDASDKGGHRSAAAELQTLTNRVVDPETFDPEKTIDEIGRGGQLSSLAAQAVGSDFLSGLPLPEPSVEDEADLTGVEGLPPVVLDITVTQGRPGS